MLERIQGLLAQLYDLEVETSVREFVCDETTARQLIGDAVDRGEALVILEEADGVSVGLYVDEAALRALEGAHEPLEREFHAFCLATEGVSHLLYLMFRAGNEEKVSQLELELQAEVDKYASALLSGNGVGLLRQREHERVRMRSSRIRQRLFRNVRFLDGHETVEGERYRLAHHVGAQYTEGLERRFLREGDADVPALLAELRRFYRMGLRQKLAASGYR